MVSLVRVVLSGDVLLFNVSFSQLFTRQALQSTKALLKWLFPFLKLKQRAITQKL